MTLIDNIKDFIRDSDKKSEYGYNGPSWEDVAEYFNAEILSEKIIDTSRWSELWEYVLKFGDGEDVAYVRARHSVGATEYQESDRLVEELHNILLVEPYEVTVTKYRPVS